MPDNKNNGGQSPWVSETKMSDFATFREKFEAYLDGTLPESLRADVEKRILADPALQAEVEIEQRINRLLCDTFVSPSPTPLDLHAADAPSSVASIDEREPESDLNSGNRPADGAQANPVPAFDATDSVAAIGPNITSDVQPRVSRRHWRRSWKSRPAIVMLAVAASIAWLFFVWQLLPKSRGVPGFQPESLVSLYQKAVDTGFEPYWECPPDRFAATFRQRQGTPLRFVATASDRQMLGLAYPGGLSRDTTAMLCRVDELPVMVFVDRREFDRPQDTPAPRSGQHLFRRELGPLVLYEVSTFEQPRMLDSLIIDN